MKKLVLLLLALYVPFLSAQNQNPDQNGRRSFFGSKSEKPEIIDGAKKSGANTGNLPLE